MKQSASLDMIGRSGTVLGVRKAVELSRESFVTAALKLVDRKGLEGLTLKAVGKELGVSHTAIYRYFDGIPSLIGAIREELLRQILVEPLRADMPRDRIIEFGLRFRQVIIAHPNFAPAFVTSFGGPEVLIPPSDLVIAEMERLGFSGNLLTNGYQALESYVAGASVWDYSGAPRHHEVRRMRLRLVRHKDFDRITRDDRMTEKNTEEAFRLGFEVLIDGLIARI
jgi:AcrR family transcriptional regulator